MKQLLVLIALFLSGTSGHSQPASGHYVFSGNTDAVNFILMGDWGRVGADHQIQVANQMGKVAESADVDFIITTGDNFYPDGVVSELDPLWRSSFEDIYRNFSLHVDWYPTLGNHDYGSNPDAQVAYSKVSRRWRMPAKYYSRTIELKEGQKALFIFIDTTPLIPGYYEEQDHRVHQQDTVAQKQWIEKQLSGRSKDVVWTFVVGHHPMYTGGGRTDNPDIIAIRNSLKPMFEKYQVDAYLSGHEHNLQHLVDGNTRQFISGSASEVTSCRMLPISKFARSEYGFMLFSMWQNRIMVQVINAEGKVIYLTELQKLNDK